MPVTEITSESQFNEYLNNNKYLFVDFHAQWCGPCKRIAPALYTLSETYTSVTFLKVDIDVCKELATRFNIRSMPTFLCFTDGNSEPSNIVIGANEMKIEYALKMLVGDDKPNEDF